MKYLAKVAPWMTLFPAAALTLCSLAHDLVSAQVRA